MKRTVIFVAMMLALCGCKSRQKAVVTERADTLAASYREALFVELEDVEFDHDVERCRGDSLPGAVRAARVRVVRGRAAEVEAKVRATDSATEQTEATVQPGRKLSFWTGVVIAVVVTGAISGALSRSRRQ